ncbi:MAG: hypothetical protein H8E64_00335 [Candidatus Marinimicrobia bacterium]|nr:hypothetical protein [Candidatus Neomarinimicrobiota bacterium]
MDELEKHFEKVINDQNNQGLVDFEGYSPHEMQFILYETFEPKSPIHLNKLTGSEYKKIPLLNQIKFLSGLIHDRGELKLTSRGYLPPNIVKNVYNQGFLKEHFIESGITKLSKELDSNTITLSRILLEIGGIVKKRYNKLSLTKNGEKLLSDDHTLLKQILSVFGSKFNWGFFDGFANDYIGQLGFGFSFILLSKYGNTKRLDTFYAEKYFNAFPTLIEPSIEPTYRRIEGSESLCYSLRTFDRFLNYFGMIKIEQKNILDENKYISKTEVFDKLINCLPHIPLENYKEFNV